MFNDYSLKYAKFGGHPTNKNYDFNLKYYKFSSLIDSKLFIFCPLFANEKPENSRESRILHAFTMYYHRRLCSTLKEDYKKIEYIENFKDNYATAYFTYKKNEKESKNLKKSKYYNNN